MITITINHNNNTCTINDGRIDTELRCERPSETIKIIQALYNILLPMEYVELVEINEDSRKTVGEW